LWPNRPANEDWLEELFEMSSPVHRKRHWYSPKSIVHSVAIRPRLYFSALAGIAALALLPRGWPASIREAVAWDLSATIYLVLAFRVMLTCKGDVLRARAARQDDSRVVILVIILLAIGASFVATGGLLAEAKDAPHRTLNLGLAAATIILAWTVTQVVFTLHYAHEYYRPSGGPQAFAEGLDFLGDRDPDYWDFFYFATSFGAASQTSDVSILTKPLPNSTAIRGTRTCDALPRQARQNRLESESAILDDAGRRRTRGSGRLGRVSVVARAKFRPITLI
jgi:uncharacterized membrane protein